MSPRNTQDPRVAAGAKFLDKKVPGWRKIMRANVANFRLANGDHCVLGTLEHKLGRRGVLAEKLRKLRDKYSRSDYNPNGYELMCKALGLNCLDQIIHDMGFNTNAEHNWDYAELEEAWRAEFNKE